MDENCFYCGGLLTEQEKESVEDELELGDADVPRCNDCAAEQEESQVF